MMTGSSRSNWFGKGSGNPDPEKKETKLNQRMKLLEFMRRNGSITSLQASDYLRILRPSNRIQELKALGYDIDTQIIYKQRRDGGYTHYAKYTLMGEPN